MKKVLILGAGASFGHGRKKTKPPLAHDFFKCSSAESLKKTYSSLLRYLDDYSKGKLTSRSAVDIEELYGMIEGFWALCQFDWKERLRKFGKEFVLVSPPQMLRSYITDIVFDSTKWLLETTCPYHDTLCSNLLNKGDIIISFNYDLIIDSSVKKHFQWHEYNGYGFLEQKLLRGVENIEKSEVILLKPHGSLNWFRSISFSKSLFNKGDEHELEKEDKIRVLLLNNALRGHTPHSSKDNEFLRTAISTVELCDQVLTNNAADPVKMSFGMNSLAVINEKEDFALTSGHIPLLVMPNRHKSFPEMSFGELSSTWRQVYDSLENADEIVAIGYSFRDLHFNQLIYEALRCKSAPVPMTIVTKSDKDATAIIEATDWLNLKVTPISGGFENYANMLT